MTRHPVFVYGTLRWQCGNDWLWHGHAVSHHDGQCFVVGYALVSAGGFPYMVRAATGQTTGALIVPAADDYEYVLDRMDALEGYREGSATNHYERITVPVITPTGIVTAWTYVPAWTPELPDVPVNGDGFYDWTLHPTAIERSARRRATTTTTERN